MKERGMIFNADMVRAILDGRKTQTRRIIKLSHERGMVNPVVCGKNGEISSVTCRLAPTLCPHGGVGDRLWVRETFASGLCTETTLAYRATHKPEDLEEGWGEAIKWTPSIHMPRWASRITLEITGVRVERLNDISDVDAMAEGCSTSCMRSGDSLSDVYARLWSSIYGADNWQANPWVWVIEFRRVEA
ncbi:hypothetical protein LF934_07560 [Dickeya dadantii]|uniref:hypothetical protein n=1 Tax=Dickeya dadantii TaxID=204038 RepID=UPI001CF1DB77|nr:hypothetical protein [Dickeya dadantii]MCA7012502.1 hypothetical protein [Dickeya dadantii]